MKNQLLSLLFLLVTVSLFAQKGSVTGTLTDKDMNNEPLPFANVVLKGTTNGVSTDDNGKYTISADPGTYVIEFSFLGYETQTETVVIEAGKTVTVDKNLGSGSYTLQDVVVQAQVNRERESALLQEQQKAVTITQQIGAQELARKGVSDAAAAVTKVTGISRQDGSSGIFVRGLGDRYNSTMLNGLPLPSNEPTNKNVALDLFSTDVIQSVAVSKTYYTDLYGDVGGANIDIKSKEHTGKTKINIEIGSGFNNYAFASNNFKVADGYKTFGFYNVNKPTVITNQYQFGTRWSPNRKSNPIDNNVGISGGTSFQIGEEGRLSIFATAAFENGFVMKRGYQMNIGNNRTIVNEDFYNVNKFDYNTKTTGLANIAYKINNKNKLKLNSVFINSSKSDVNEFDFLNENQTNSFSRQTVTEQNKLFVNQLHGEHELSNRWDLNWGGSFATVKADMPDRITNTLLESENGYVFNANQPASNNRYFQLLDEVEFSARALASVKVIKKADEADYKGKITFGYNGRIKNRDFEATQFNFRINSNNPIEPNNIDSFLNAANQANTNGAPDSFRILTGRNAQSLVPF
ncbi:MAG: TonB-dependent receptor, partial [Chitinophagaceae bacterium]